MTFRSDVVDRINRLVDQAQSLLQDADRLARENGIPFEYDLSGKVDEPQWEPSEWETSYC